MALSELGQWELGTRELVEDELPADVTLKDLGEHRLRNIARADRLHHVPRGAEGRSRGSNTDLSGPQLG